MRGAIQPLPQNASMTWCSIKKTTRKTLPLPLIIIIIIIIMRHRFVPLHYSRHVTLCISWTMPLKKLSRWQPRKRTGKCLAGSVKRSDSSSIKMMLKYFVWFFPKNPSKSDALYNISQQAGFLRWIVRSAPNPQAGVPLLVGCPRLLTQYVCCYPPYLEAISYGLF